MLFKKKTKMPEFMFGMSPIRRPKTKGIFRDSDKDGMPDPIDCQPHNPREQGKVGDWLKEKGTQYKEWKARAPERRAERHETQMEKLKYRKEEAAERAEVAGLRRKEYGEKAAVQKERLGLQKERTILMERRAKAMPSLGGLDITSSRPRVEKGAIRPSVMTPMPTGFGIGAVKSVEYARPVKRKKRKKTYKIPKGFKLVKK